jgi:hypothetical protein
MLTLNQFGVWYGEEIFRKDCGILPEEDPSGGGAGNLDQVGWIISLVQKP